MMITSFAILTSLLLFSFIYYNLFSAQVFEDLKTYAHFIVRGIQSDENMLASMDLADSNIRVTLMGLDGVVFYDNKADVESMDNHANRNEVQDALELGEGQSIRHSDTVGESTYYVALQVEEQMIVRVAQNSMSIFSLYLGILHLLLAVTAILFIICYFAAKRLSDHILFPIEQLCNNMKQGEQGTKNDAMIYEEIKPFLETIHDQHADIVKSSKLRQEFTANVSHELKTPLTAISGYAELIETGMAKDADASHFATEIRKNAKRLLSLINDILELSKLDADFEQELLEEVDLLELSKSCAGMLELNAKDHDVTVTVDGDHALVEGNHQMLEEVIYNLCDNGIRYNRVGGSVTIHVQNKVDTVVFQIVDTGIGIPTKHKERIFERFYRVDKGRSSNTGGTGLGLAIVKHIIMKHGATLMLESEEGIGTTIRITFMKKREHLQ